MIPIRTKAFRVIHLFSLARMSHVVRIYIGPLVLAGVIRWQFCEFVCHKAIKKVHYITPQEPETNISCCWWDPEKCP